MNKMNKKGFTLIEMLVVIAIIAVLVSIIVPTVSNSTLKASAAANAANLRSYKAELSLDLLDDNTINGTTGGIVAPTMKVCGTYLTSEAKANYAVDADGNITVGVGELGIDYFATIAETGKDTGAVKVASIATTNSDVAKAS